MTETKEIEGFDTLNPLMYKFANMLVMGNLVIFLLFLIFTGINYWFFPQNFWYNISSLVTTILALMCFIIQMLITNSSLKKNDLIIIRKFRNSSGKITKTKYDGRSEIFFDPRDPSSKVSISWVGSITDKTSGCKIIQLTEGNHINDNLNEQVTESEWDKDVAKLTKAKSVADLAEAELFNQGILGLKWQDIVLIIIGLLVLGTLGYLVLFSPGSIAEETVKQLVNGAIQQAVAGIVTPAIAPVA